MSNSNTDLRLSFLWLELTNKCNLACVHCCTESSLEAGKDDVLTEADYSNALYQAAGLQCPEVQFIGGEPVLNQALPKLIVTAGELAFETIQVYTNLTMISDNLFELYRCYDVVVLTSVYGHTAEVHDTVTQNPGSFNKTLRNLKLLSQSGIRVKPSVISMPSNRPYVASTLEFLEELGFEDVGSDEVREFGRASSSEPQMESLCGSCAGSTLSIKPDGRVTPCLMAAPWLLGMFPQQSLSEILKSEETAHIRQQIAEATGETAGGCNPNGPKCSPDSGGTCNPCSPNGHCGPNDCKPKRSFVGENIVHLSH